MALRPSSPTASLQTSRPNRSKLYAQVFGGIGGKRPPVDAAAFKKLASSGQPRYRRSGERGWRACSALGGVQVSEAEKGTLAEISNALGV